MRRATRPRTRISSNGCGRGLKYRESVVEGLRNAPKAFIGLLSGKNLGKQLIRLV